jgi:hypothetical protein
MSLTVTEGSGFKQIAPGTYGARCIRVIDLGTQMVRDFNNADETKEKHQVMLTWELPGELIPEGELMGQPYAVSRFYTAMLGDKANLRKDLEAWRGKNFTDDELKGFSLNAVLGKACMVSVVHSKTGKANVKAVLALPKGMQVPAAVNPIYSYDMEADGFGEKFETLTKGVQKMIHGSKEYQALTGIPVDHTDGASASPGEDEIPF